MAANDLSFPSSGPTVGWEVLYGQEAFGSNIPLVRSHNRVHFHFATNRVHFTSSLIGKYQMFLYVFCWGIPGFVKKKKRLGIGAPGLFPQT